jgi:hypothetical protein
MVVLVHTPGHVGAGVRYGIRPGFRVIARLLSFVRSLFSPLSVRLAIVRRYADANGSYVGELYMDNGKGSYGMVGASLDTLPLDWEDGHDWTAFQLDTKNDFLAIPTPNMVRVGAMDPRDNDRVRAMVAALPRRGMTLAVQNRFMTDLRPSGRLAFNLSTRTPEQLVEEFDRPC